MSRSLSQLLCAIAATAAATTAFATAELRSVDGNVLVSTKDGFMVATDKLRVESGVTVSTTARGTVTVVFDAGCEIKLEPNQRLLVRSGTPCAALLASVEPIALAPAVAVAPTGSTIAGASLLAFGASTGTGIYLYNRNSRNVSPN